MSERRCPATPNATAHDGAQGDGLLPGPSKPRGPHPHDIRGQAEQRRHRQPAGSGECETATATQRVGAGRDRHGQQRRHRPDPFPGTGWPHDRPADRRGQAQQGDGPDDPRPNRQPVHRPNGGEPGEPERGDRPGHGPGPEARHGRELTDAIAAQPRHPGHRPGQNADGQARSPHQGRRHVTLRRQDRRAIGHCRREDGDT